MFEKSRAARVQQTENIEAVRTAAELSLLSLTNIGFQQFTLGDWIQRLLISS